MEDYDTPEVEERWCGQQRTVVATYLLGQNVQHGRIGDWPAWHLAPYVSIWAIESLAHPDWIGWWVICGDCPTDCIPATDVEPPQHPRKAIRVIAERWIKQAEAWREGRDFADIKAPESHSREELAPLLSSRANLLLEWASTPYFWEE